MKPAAACLTTLCTMLAIAAPRAGNAQSDPLIERQLGNRQHKRVISEMIPLYDDALSARISAIGEDLVKASTRPRSRFRFLVLNDPAVNAFAVADGYVYVTTGLLDVLQDESQLAAVMAHEIAHVCEHHMENRIVAQQRVGFALSVVSVVAQGFVGAATAPAAGITSSASAQIASNMSQQITSNITQRVIGGIGGPAAMAILLGYGRKQELESDRLAVEYLRKAGRDPHSFVRALERLKSYHDESRSAGNAIVSSLINAEPGLDERIVAARGLAEPAAPVSR